MQLKRRFTLLLVALTIAACGPESDDPASGGTDMPKTLHEPFAGLTATPPVAGKRPVEIEQHGVKRVDNYAWLRDEDWQEVLRDPGTLDADIRSHLEAENGYYEEATDDLETLRQQLFEEMRGRIKEDDSTVPAVDGDFAYAVRFREGGEYPVYVRTPRDGGPETILYDGDLEGKGEEFFRIAAVSHSPNHALIAYGVDRLGSEYYDIRIRTVNSGEEYAETIPSTDGSVTWAADSKSFYYVERDDNQRPKRVRHHLVGTNPADDRLVYEEPDDSYFLDIASSQSDAYIFLVSGKGTSSEYRYLRADAAPGTEPALIAPRLEDEIYHVDHAGDYFYIRTNVGDAVERSATRLAPIPLSLRHGWLNRKPARPLRAGTGARRAAGTGSRSPPHRTAASRSRSHPNIPSSNPRSGTRAGR